MSIAQVVKGNVNFNAGVTQTETSGQINPGGNSLTNLISLVFQYVNAQGVNYGVDQVYAAQITLASTTLTIHPETATLDDPFGNTLAMKRYRDIIVQNTNTTFGQDLEWYSSSSDGVGWLPTTPGNIVRAGGLDWRSDPLSFGATVGNYVTATTDGITFNSLSATVIFNVVIVGNSVP
jgi:hypothetical protein